jgi:hypothetical protein
MFEPWMSKANCVAPGVDPELFFSDDPEEKQWAKDVCTGCPVVSTCAMFADRLGVKHGIWAGGTRTLHVGAVTDLSEDSESEELDETAILIAMGGEPALLTTVERHEAVRRLHAQGLFDRQIADRLHCAAKTVERDREYLQLRAHGVAVIKEAG